MQHGFSTLAAPLCCAAALLLSACQGTGQGPITLSPYAAAGFEEYSDVRGEKAFAVTADGRSYGYAYCIDIRCTGNEASAAMENCERGRKEQGLLNTSCRLFARNNAIIWQGDVAIPETPS